MRLYDLAETVAELAKQVDRLAQVTAGIALVHHHDPLADLAKDISLQVRSLMSDTELEVEGTAV